jgi:hypothetical protein
VKEVVKQLVKMNPQINPSTELRTGLGAKRLAPRFIAGSNKATQS